MKTGEYLELLLLKKDNVPDNQTVFVMSTTWTWGFKYRTQHRSDKIKGKTKFVPVAKHRGTKTGDVEVKPQLFYTSALDGDEWLHLGSGCLTWGGRFPGTICSFRRLAVHNLTQNYRNQDYN
jgi:hypothetical protein